MGVDPPANQDSALPQQKRATNANNERDCSVHQRFHPPMNETAPVRKRKSLSKTECVSTAQSENDRRRMNEWNYTQKTKMVDE